MGMEVSVFRPSSSSSSTRNVPTRCSKSLTNNCYTGLCMLHAIGTHCSHSHVKIPACFFPCPPHSYPFFFNPSPSFPSLLLFNHLLFPSLLYPFSSPAPSFLSSLPLFPSFPPFLPFSLPPSPPLSQTPLLHLLADVRTRRHYDHQSLCVRLCALWLGSFHRKSYHTPV